MSKISVKIPTIKVITALSESLTKLDRDYKSQTVNEEKYQKAHKAWNKAMQDFAIKNIAKRVNDRISYRSWNNTLNFDFDLTVAESELPKMPERDFVALPPHEYNEKKGEIESALRILKMTDEETVSTSTYRSIAQYL